MNSPMVEAGYHKVLAEFTYQSGNIMSNSVIFFTAQLSGHVILSDGEGSVEAGIIIKDDTSRIFVYDFRF